MSTEPETQQPSTPDESVAAAPASAPKKLEQPAMWPGNVPAQEQALEVLRGRLTLAVSLPGARKLQEKLTQPERESLQTDGVADALREAVVMRWRLAAAQDLLLTAGGHVDTEALNTLLAQADHALESLRAAAPATPELGLAIDRTWEALTQEAVDFSSNVKEAAKQPVEHKPHPAAHKPAPTAGKVTFQAADPSAASKGNKTKIQLALLAVLLLAVGGYNVASLFASPERPSNYTGAPNNTFVVSDAKSGTLMVRSTLSGPPSAEQLAWIKQQEAKGMQVKELQPGNWLLTPAPKAPATAGNTSP